MNYSKIHRSCIEDPLNHKIPGELYGTHCLATSASGAGVSTSKLLSYYLVTESFLHFRGPLVTWRP